MTMSPGERELLRISFLGAEARDALFLIVRNPRNDRDRFPGDVNGNRHYLSLSHSRG